MTLRKRRLLFAGAVQRTTAERLNHRVVLGTMVGWDNPGPGRRPRLQSRGHLWHLFLQSLGVTCASEPHSPLQSQPSICLTPHNNLYLSRMKNQHGRCVGALMSLDRNIGFITNTLCKWTGLVCLLEYFPKVCSIRYVPRRTGGIYRRFYRCRTLRLVRYGVNTGTKSFGKFRTTSISVPETSVSSVRLPYRYRRCRYRLSYRYRTLRQVRYDVDTGTGNFR